MRFTHNDEGWCFVCAMHRFASALSVLAERRTLLERIFVTKSINPNGVYAMRLCKDGRWVDVIVDDRLPCTSDGRLCFCKVSLKIAEIRM